MKFKYDDINFYTNPNPQKGELVSCIPYEIDNHMTIIKFKLYEYNKKGIMTFAKATRKKKKPNWNNICPLNKHNIAMVESVSEQSIELSFIDINKDDQTYKKYLETEKANYTIYSLIKAISKINNLPIKELWEILIHPLDKIRINNNSEKNLLDLLKENIDTILNNETYNFNEKTCNKIKSILTKKNKKEKITTKFTLVSLKDINEIKRIFDRVLEKYDKKLNIYRDNGAYYYIKSNHINISKEDHEIVIETIKTTVKDNDNILFKT